MVKKRKKKKSRIKIYRRILQIFVALLFILIPWLNSRHISFVYGNFLSFNMAGLPLADPLAVLQMTLKNAYLSTDLFAGALVALVIALFFGTVFCSWICPFGLLSDFAQSISQLLILKTKKRKKVQLSGFKIKIVLFLTGLAGFLIFSTTPVLNQFSLPAWYSRIFQFIFTQKHFSYAIVFILFILTVEFFFKIKVWCRYICPQSVLLILVKQLNNKIRLKVNFQPEKCLNPRQGNEPCIESCSMGLDPRNLPADMETDCTNCGDCIVICRQFGQALKFKF
jgi:ferredoxin-type protein NapH